MKPVSWVLVTIGAVMATGLVACVMGMASRVVYVIGLSPILLGLAAGGTVSIGSLNRVGGLVKGAWSIAMVAIVIASCGLQFLEDWHFRKAYRADFVHARVATSGLPTDVSVAPSEEAFYGAGVDAALKEEMERQVGFSGAFGRWLFRADSGVRLFGPWRESRGLAVGRWGSMFWMLCELLIASFVARSVIGRVTSLTLESQEGAEDA